MIIERIGAAPTPAERGLQVLLEKPEVLDRAARNLFANYRYGDRPGDLWVTSQQIDDEWAAASEQRKEYFRKRAIEKQHEHIAKERTEFVKRGEGSNG